MRNSQVNITIPMENFAAVIKLQKVLIKYIRVRGSVTEYTARKSCVIFGTK